MQIGMVGLGRMGGNMARRLMRAGHECVVFDLGSERVAELAADGAAPAEDLGGLVQRLEPPRTVWLMVPAGPPTDATIDELSPLLAAGDTIVDGGNTFFKDDVRRAKALGGRGIVYLDVGTSGGVWGLERGYCLMIGGAEEAVRRLSPIFAALAPGRGAIPPTSGLDAGSTALEGYLYCGPTGAGHFVKMIHNGIEYALMQAYAEGFDLLHSAGRESTPADYRYELDLAAVAEVWRRGSVITSWLLDLAAAALAESRDLAGYVGSVQDSGEGRWTVDTAVEQAVPVPAIAAALFARFRSREANTFGEKLLSALRDQFGGHREGR